MANLIKSLSNTTPVPSFACLTTPKVSSLKYRPLPLLTTPSLSPKTLFVKNENAEATKKRNQNDDDAMKNSLFFVFRRRTKNDDDDDFDREGEMKVIFRDDVIAFFSVF